jgi:hypothetical protein
MIEQSPEWWLVQLHRRLMVRAPKVRMFEDYYDGHHPLSFVTTEYRQEFATMLRGVSDNWMALVVDAVEERLHVEGFRMGDDPAGDTDAWRIWQENCLDADSEMLHSTALQTGSAFALVWYGEDEQPEITVEHPGQCYVAYESGGSRKRAAALKSWIDEWTGDVRANVYLPDGIYKFQSKRAITLDEYRTESGRDRRLDVLGAMWKPVDGDSAFVENPLGVVPIVEFRNRPRLLGDGRSEIVDVISVQNQINKLVCDMLVAAEFSAFKQRWATGVEIPTDPMTGKPLQAYASAVDRLWNVESDTAKFGEFGETNLGNYVAALENRVQSLASRTRTPPHYLLGSSGSFPSGESLKATETGLIAKCRSRHRHFGESWEEVMRLAFAVLDDPRSEARMAETIWTDPESRSEAEHTDSLLKKMSMGVPVRQLWEDAGYSQTQIDRFGDMLVAEAEQRARVAAADKGPERELSQVELLAKVVPAVDVVVNADEARAFVGLSGGFVKPEVPKPAPVRRMVERDASGRVAGVVEQVS